QLADLLSPRGVSRRLRERSQQRRDAFPGCSVPAPRGRASREALGGWWPEPTWPNLVHSSDIPVGAAPLDGPQNEMGYRRERPLGVEMGRATISSSASRPRRSSAFAVYNRAPLACAVAAISRSMTL